MTEKVVTVTLNPAIDQTLFIPCFEARKVNRVDSFFSYPGGKGVNIASLISDYGFDVTVTGFLGNENSDIFEQLFKKKKIKDRFIRINGKTRIGIKVADSQNLITTDINLPGQHPTSREVDFQTKVILEESRSAEWLVLAGSLPVGVSDNFYKEIIEKVKSNGVKVALDTSGTPLKYALTSCPNLIKPNLDELQEIIGQKLNSIEDVINPSLFIIVIF